MTQPNSSLPALLSVLPDKRRWPQSGTARLRQLIGALLEIDAWAESQGTIAATDPSVAAAVEASRQLVRDNLVSASQRLVSPPKEALGARDSGDAFDRCAERIQETNQEAARGLQEASGVSERVDVIVDWGRQQAENIGQCIDDAFR